MRENSNNNNFYYLKQDIAGYDRKVKKTYGKQGDKVQVISDHGNVFIVKGKELFSVNKDLLTETIQL